MAFNELGFFQFDNLVRNRIGFVLLLINATLENVYTGLEKDHIKKASVELTSANVAQALEKMAERNVNQQDAIVILCKDGEQSRELAEALEEQGFINVYFITGGLTTLLQ
jgi:rhodanese-related sulfurtransferase